MRSRILQPENWVGGLWIVLLISFFSLIFQPHCIKAEMTPISQREMSTITAREGLKIDLNFGSSFQISKVDYTDADGAASASSTSGTLQLDQICLELGCNDSISLNGLTIDFTDSTNLNGSGSGSDGAIVFDFPSTSGLEPDITDIYLGDPSGNPALSALEINDLLIGNTSMEIGAQSEGFISDISLNMSLNNFQFDDSNGFAGAAGTAGTFKIGSLTLDNGSGGTTELHGLTVDSSSSVDLNGTTQAAVVLDAPSGSLDVSASNITVDSSQYTSNLSIKGLKMDNTTVEVGAN
ncbi:MAG: DUF6160 family protein [bacterium]